MTGDRDTTARLQRLLRVDAAAAGCTIRALDEDSHAVPWRCAWFDGTRHHLHFQARVDGRLDAWLGTLDAREWRVPGQLVIDWAVARHGDRLILTALALDPDSA